MSYPTEILKCPKCWTRFGTPIENHQHQQSCRAVMVTPVDKWGKRPLFQAKIGTHSGTLILVKRARRSGQPFEEHERVEYVDYSEVKDRSVGMAPQTWHDGVVWKVEDNRIFISRGAF